MVYNRDMSQDIFYWLRRYLEYLEIEKGRSVHTINAYERFIKRFIEHSGASKPADIDYDKVREFRLWLNRQPSNTGTLKKNTQNKYLIALRSFLKYLERQDVQTLAAAKIELAKTSMREIDIMTDKEFERLMEAPSKQTLEDTRDKAILEILFSTGLRVSELCSLNSDLDIDADEFTIRGKGEKLRIVFISETAREAVKKYLAVREQSKFPKLSDALFVMSTGARIYPRAVQRILDKRGKQAGIMRDISPHGIRHYFATNLLKNGADIRSVQMMLGHASINTTQVYTNISDTYLKEVHKKFHNKKV